MAEAVQTVVAGAGVVGLAVARRLALAGHETVVLEADAAIGGGISSRNSEVVHAGLYYPAGSLKARCCVAGRAALYDFCASHGVPCERIGKLIVATDDSEIDALHDIRRKAAANGVRDLRWIDAAAARALEPAVRCRAALLSPATGIVDSHALMLALRGDAEEHGALVALASPLLGGRLEDGAIRLRVGGAEPMELRCRNLVNCAGLQAQSLAASLQGLASASIPPRHLAKGNYFTLSGPSPFRRLIYPVPVPGGLGVHATLDLGRQVKFGPDVEWIDRLDYHLDPRRAASFYGAVRRYWPGLPDGALRPGYVGVRPKLHRQGEPAADFVVQGPRAHGVPGLVNLYGIESPGLTSALALADHVAELLGATAGT